MRRGCEGASGRRRSRCCGPAVAGGEDVDVGVADHDGFGRVMVLPARCAGFGDEG